MLVLTRRPGESVMIGETIELHIVAVEWSEPETRCAIQIMDADGNELALRCVKSRDGSLHVIGDRSA